MVGQQHFASLNLTYGEGKRLLNDPLRVSHDRTPALAFSLSLPADHREHSVQLVSLHKNVTSL
jgi:hypothetical protein